MLVAFLLSVAGFLLFALSQARHRLTLRRSPLSIRGARTLRFAGCIALVAALAASIAVQGASFGTLSWVALLTVGAALVSTILTMRARD